MGYGLKNMNLYPKVDDVLITKIGRDVLIKVPNGQEIYLTERIIKKIVKASQKNK